MKYEEEELEKCEKHLFEELLAVILFLNKNGIAIERVKEMINIKVDRAFIEYEELKERFKRDNQND